MNETIDHYRLKCHFERALTTRESIKYLKGSELSTDRLLKDAIDSQFSNFDKLEESLQQDITRESKKVFKDWWGNYPYRDDILNNKVTIRPFPKRKN
ncbi:hypothetical protein SAMN04515674_105292 [Pseudarcicella hirudinis]|uniref:Uncharacterized protein n=1 Tax=Pseudarcicella hirudinis TaxID=1079859 RepID=A0A1I5SZH0_9BACT|nr:hypothetical protein [Pseudarcicella hirudinis]SFP76108.1 hypothetical protein SAMN04515674_105292 [Pseudarcicella hirudinis]